MNPITSWTLGLLAAGGLAAGAVGTAATAASSRTESGSNTDLSTLRQELSSLQRQQLVLDQQVATKKAAASAPRPADTSSEAEQRSTGIPSAPRSTGFTRTDPTTTTTTGTREIDPTTTVPTTTVPTTTPGDEHERVEHGE